MADINVYDIGDVVRVVTGDAGDAAVLGFSQAGTAVDPGTVRCKLRDPRGNVTTYTYGDTADIVKDATGRYHLDCKPTVHGVWTYRWEGLVSAEAAEEKQFRVKNSAFD